MIRRPAKFRSILWVSLLLLFSLVLLSLTVSPPQDRAPRWHETLFFALLSPFQRVTTVVSDQVHSVVTGYFYLVDVEKENRVLKKEGQQLQEKLLLHQSVLEEANRLRTLLEFKKFSTWKTMAARVSGYGPQAEFRLLTINRGTRDGVRRHMPVVAAEGLVGRIYRTGSRASQVLLITDPTSAVDGRVESTGARGLIRGRLVTTTWDRRHFLTALEFVDRATVVPAGSTVLTSGLDGIFPVGIPIGIVQKVSIDSQGLFKEAQVLPQVEMMELQEVVVILDWEAS